MFVNRAFVKLRWLFLFQVCGEPINVRGYELLSSAGSFTVILQ